MAKLVMKDILKSNDIVRCLGVKVSVQKLDAGEWVIIVAHSEGKLGDVVIGWYRTRKLARQHAKKIREAILNFN
jgi:hypothetical protein